jgi:integrase
VTRRKRRRGIRGTVFRRGNKWSYVIDVSPDLVTGKRRQRWGSGYATEWEAWEALAEANRQLRDGPLVKPVNLTVSAFLSRWLDTIKVEVKPTTHANYAALANAYVIPHLGQRRMRDIEPQTISELYRRLFESGRRKRDANAVMFEHWRKRTKVVSAAELATVGEVSRSAGARALGRYRAGRFPKAGSGLSAKTIASIHIMLRAAFNDAASPAWNVIRTNPVPHASRPRVPRSHRTTWKPAELTAFLRTARDERLYAMWLLFATTGVRRSEVAGAHLAGLDLQTLELSVGPTRVVAAGRAHDSDGKSPSSVRTFALDPITARVLHGHLDMLARERLEHGDAYHDHGLMFCWPDGSKIYPDTITRQFNRLVDQAGLPHIGLHDVRHTYATMALRAGVNPKTVSARIGHASVAFTLQAYTDSVPEVDRADAERVASLFLTADLDVPEH